ncbi:hypothetical protein EVA_22107 [gut metagenome]|uniref:Uncharacterized protein n=1 Tax=gut metagenome TaxID=749906 RepID=J9FQY6_9ZZZZ
MDLHPRFVPFGFVSFMLLNLSMLSLLSSCERNGFSN